VLLLLACGFYFVPAHCGYLLGLSRWRFRSATAATGLCLRITSAFLQRAPFPAFSIVPALGDSLCAYRRGWSGLPPHQRIPASTRGLSVTSLTNGADGAVHPRGQNSGQVKTALQVRHEAALFLLAKGQLGPEEALMAVVWPKSERLDEEGLERVKEWPAETRDEGLRLFDSGLTKREVASRLGVCETTVKGWLGTRSKWAKRRAAA